MILDGEKMGLGFIAEPKAVDFLAQGTMNEIRRFDLGMAMRGMWLSCLLLIAQYPADFEGDKGSYASEPIPLARLCKLLGSQRRPVERALAALEDYGLIRHDENGRLWNTRPDLVEVTGG